MKKTYTLLFLIIATNVYSQHQLPGGIGVEIPTTTQLPNVALANNPCFLKNKKTQKVLQTLNIPADQKITQFTLTAEVNQKFILQDAGAGFFYIRTNNEHYLTASSDLKIFHRGLITPVAGAALLDKNTQKWFFKGSGERGCFTISNKAFPGKSLQASTSNENDLILITKNVNNDRQIWIVKYYSFENNPNAGDADAGLVYDCSIRLNIYWLWTKSQDITRVLPEWRTVGELDYPAAENLKLKPNFRILEGIVDKIDPPHIAFEDLPMAHYTHDFDFLVKPDSLYKYLRGKTAGVVQEHVAVEWESGIGQGFSKTFNPAAMLNRSGDSYGFFTNNHKRQDIIKNWPVANDWVHVEGNWIWDRGHDDPIKTEIHPPHFIGIKRNLPEKINIPGGFVYATRCDVYANGDGNTLWNNKGNTDYAQPVNMRRSFTVIFNQDLQRPNPTAKLKYKIVNQNGNSYVPDGRVIINEKGTADNPNPHIVFTIPWQSDNQPNNAVFAKTLFIFWDDIVSHGVSSDEHIKEVRITLDSLIILNKGEGHDTDPGEYRVFASIGNDWFFLNEFVSGADILNEGLGKTWDINYSNEHMSQNAGAFSPYPVPIGSQSKYDFHLVYTAYVPIGKEIVMTTCGWEGDYIEDQFGHLLNPYTRCEKAKSIADSYLSLRDYKNNGGLDDPIGRIKIVHRYNDIIQNYSKKSSGPIAEDKIGDTDPTDSYEVIFKLE